MIFQKGDKIGNYTVTFPHKQGSYAETYRVKDTMGKNRFLKLINLSCLNRFQVNDDGQVIEIEIGKQLVHDNLCKYIDSGNITLSGSPYAYLVIEYISGETLSERIIRDGQLQVYDIKQVAKSVLTALNYLHSLPTPILHNEVTIQNIMLNSAGSLKDLKLIDFGHACYLNQTAGKPDINELNVFYLAPERFSGVSSIQSDLYSVGAMMYHLLYGKLPWFLETSRLKNEEIVDEVLAARDSEIEAPLLDMFELDEQLINIIIKALCQDADERFRTATDFIKALDGEIIIDRQSTKRHVLSNATSSKKPVEITPKKGKGFSAIAGMDELKSILREEVIEPLHHPEEYKQYGITIPNGMLLYGPPGCGKTFFAKHFAEEVGFNFMAVTPSTLQSRYVNATQENIAQMFADAIKKAPTIIFIDEMNEIVPNRDNNMHEMYRSAVNEMLAQMDRTGDKGVFVIGATNYPDTIDPAILRAGRLDKKYYVGLPDHAARKGLFELYLKDRPYDFGLDYDGLAQLTEGYVSADIKLIVDNASRAALKQHSKITMALIKNAIEGCLPSIDKKEIARYETIKAQMEGKLPQNEKRNKIGFRQ